MNDLISPADFEKQREATFLRLSALTQFVARNSVTESTLVELTGRLLEVRTPQELWPFHIILKQLPSTWPFVQANGNVLCLVIKQLLILAKRSVSVLAEQRECDPPSYGGGASSRVMSQQPVEIEGGRYFPPSRKGPPSALLKAAAPPSDSKSPRCSETQALPEEVGAPNGGNAVHADGCPVASPHRCVLRRGSEAAVSQPSVVLASAGCPPSGDYRSGVAGDKSQPLPFGHPEAPPQAAEWESSAPARMTAWRPRTHFGLQTANDAGRRDYSEWFGLPSSRGDACMSEVPLGHANVPAFCSKPALTGFAGQSWHASPPYTPLASYAVHSAVPHQGPAPLWYSGSASNFNNLRAYSGAFVPPLRPLGVQFYASGRLPPQQPSRQLVSSDYKRTGAVTLPSSALLPAKQMDALSASLSGSSSIPGSSLSATQKLLRNRGRVFPPRATCRKRIASKLSTDAQRGEGEAVENSATPSQAAIRAAGATLRAFLQDASSTSDDAHGSAASGERGPETVLEARSDLSDPAVSFTSCTLAKEKSLRSTEKGVAVSSVGGGGEREVSDEHRDGANAPALEAPGCRVSTVLRALETALYEAKTGSTEKKGAKPQQSVSAVVQTPPHAAEVSATTPRAVILPVPAALSSVSDIIDLDTDEPEDAEAVEEEQGVSTTIGGGAHRSEDPRPGGIETREGQRPPGSAEAKNREEGGGVSISTVDPSTGPSEDDQTSPPSAGDEPPLQETVREVIERPTTIERRVTTPSLVETESNRTPLVELPELIWGPPPVSQSVQESTTPSPGRRKRHKENGKLSFQTRSIVIEECLSDEDRVTSGGGFDWSKLRGVGARSFETSMNDIMSMFDCCASTEVSQVSREQPPTEAAQLSAPEFYSPIAERNARKSEADWPRWQSCERPVQNVRRLRRCGHFMQIKRNGKRPAVSSALPKNGVNQGSSRDGNRVRKSQGAGLTGFSAVTRNAPTALCEEGELEGASNPTAWWDGHSRPINLFNTRGDEERLYLYLSTSSAETVPPFLQPPYCVPGSVVLDWEPCDWSDSSASCDVGRGRAVVQQNDTYRGKSQQFSTPSDNRLLGTAQQKAIVHATAKPVEPKATHSKPGSDISPTHSDPESVTLLPVSPEPGSQKEPEHAHMLLPLDNVCTDEVDSGDRDVMEVVYVFISPSDEDDDVAVCS